MKLLNILSLALTVHIQHVLAASGTPGVSEDLDKQYRIHFETTDTSGCLGFEDLLRDTYAEAFKTAGIAIDALKIIRGAKPDATDAAAFAKWGRIARVFSALFGAGDTTFRARRGNVVDSVKGKFEDMQADISENPLLSGLFSGNPPASIYCSDAWEKSLRTTDIDPLDTADPQRPISVTRPDVKVGLSFSIPDNLVGEKKVANFDPSCGPGNLAFTSRGFSAITFCPDTLNLKTSVTASITNRKPTIQVNDPIGNHRTMTEMWIHEWNHLLSSGTDANAVDATGAPILDAKNNPVTAYGWDHTVNLAKNNPAAAQNLPDAYAIFANAMFFDNFDWSNGHAVAYPV